MEVLATDEDKYVILLSGINYAHNTAQIWFQMFVDFCCGLLGGSYDQRMNSKLVRVIIAGDSLGSGPDDVSDLRDSWERNRVITLFTYYVHPLYNFRERYVINTLSNTLSTPTAHSRICVYDCDMCVC